MKPLTRAAVVLASCAIVVLIARRNDLGLPNYRQHSGAEGKAAIVRATQNSKPLRRGASEKVPMGLPATPSGQPVAQIQHELRFRAEQGDAAAASLLARDLYFCWAMLEQANLPKPDYRSPDEPRELSEEEQGWIDAWEASQAYIEKNAVYCEGLPADEIDRLKVFALLKAAQLGDEEAAACFVSDSMFYARTIAAGQTYPAERDDADLATLYETEALPLAEAGIAKGDWRMVLFLSSAYSVGDSANPFGNKVVRVNNEKKYLYASLQQLGCIDPDQLQRIKELPLQPADFGLSDAKAQELRDEAQRLFESYFRDSGPLPVDVTLCDMSAAPSSSGSR